MTSTNIYRDMFKKILINTASDQSIALILINILGDVNLIKYVINHLRRQRESDGRLFHCSLRISNVNNSSVPLSCNLPFTAFQWRNSKDLMRSINLLYPGFITLTRNYIDGDGLTDFEYIREDNFGIRRGNDVKNIGDIDGLYIKEMNNCVKKILNIWDISKIVNDFKNIIQSYDDWNTEMWSDEMWFDLPIVEYNINSGRYYIIRNED